MSARRTARHVLAAAAIVCGAVLAGCATPPSVPTASQWSGRLALTLSTDPPRRWSAGFSLNGTPSQGDLRLYNPLGQTVATIRWDGTAAWLDRADGTTRQYGSLAELTTELTGAALPVVALFAWLSGTTHEVAGWQVDLAEQPKGRLRAQRLDPPPAAELRLIWQP